MRCTGRTLFEQSGLAAFAGLQIDPQCKRRRILGQPITEVSLYDRISGEPAVNAAIAHFCVRVLSGAELKGFLKKRGSLSHG